MNDSVPVGFGKSFTDLRNDLKSARDIQLFSEHQLAQSLAFDQFHGVVRLALFGFAVVVNRRDVPRRESRNGPSFAQEAGAEVPVLFAVTLADRFNGQASA